MFRLVSVALLVLLTCEASASGSTISYIPRSGVEYFIVNELDIATFPSSIRPRLGPYHHFRELRIQTSSIKPNEILLKDFWSGWIYHFDIFSRGDFNGDGVEDLEVCFTDNGHPAGGSYYSIEPLLLTRLSANGPLIATAYKPIDMRCQPNPK